MQVLQEGAQRVWAAVDASRASQPFVMDTRMAIGLSLSALVAFISGPGGQGGSSFYVVVFCALLRFPLAEAAGTAAFVVFVGSVASAVSAVWTLNPVTPLPAPLIDYDSGGSGLGLVGGQQHRYGAIKQREPTCAETPSSTFNQMKCFACTTAQSLFA